MIAEDFETDLVSAVAGKVVEDRENAQGIAVAANIEDDVSKDF
jgi:hypothetical protein